jgi:menaquinone-specific isochorismate synthase
VEPEPGAVRRSALDRLTVRTVGVPDPGDLLARLPGPSPHSGPVAWVRRGDGLAGWGEAARVVLPAGVDRFTAGEKWLRELFDTAEVHDDVGLPGTGLVAFGGFTFDPASEGSVLVIPRYLLGRRDGQAWLTTVGAEPAVLAGVRLRPDAPGEPAAAQLPRPAPPSAGPGEIRWHDGGLTAPQWEQAVATAVARIRGGELQKVVLARDLHATASADIDVRTLLTRLAARYPDCYTFSCAGLIGASPELLIERDGPQISVLVLAGTTPRGASPAEDEALGAALLASAKNVEEHSYAVDSVRAALAPRCATLDTEPRPWLLRLANVQHLATRVRGELAPGKSAPTSLALAATLHPTAAVCGAPTAVAMELIRDLEQMDRGRYAGPVGWIDADGNGEWAIALRCAEVSGPRARLFAGCGIVADSDPEAELAETQAKFRPMAEALES